MSHFEDYFRSDKSLKVCTYELKLCDKNSEKNQSNMENLCDPITFEFARILLCVTAVRFYIGIFDNFVDRK